MYIFNDYHFFTSSFSAEILNAESSSAGYCLFLFWFFFPFLIFFNLFFDSLKYRKIPRQPYLDEENLDFRHDLPQIFGQ